MSIQELEICLKHFYYTSFVLLGEQHHKWNIGFKTTNNSLFRGYIYFNSYRILNYYAYEYSQNWKDLFMYSESAVSGFFDNPEWERRTPNSDLMQSIRYQNLFLGKQNKRLQIWNTFIRNFVMSTTAILERRAFSDYVFLQINFSFIYISMLLAQDDFVQYRVGP